MPTPSPEMTCLLHLAKSAAREIMAIYETEFSIDMKSDSSPVTLADTKAEKIIIDGLNKHFPNVPIVAEEQVAAGHIPAVGNRFFLVDPLDGTREFVSRNGEFTVNIALVENGQAVSGVVYAPAKAQLFWGEKSNGAGFATAAIEDEVEFLQWTALQARETPRSGAIAVASRSHLDADTKAFLEGAGIQNLTNAGSSLKFCLIAMAQADLYPRFGRTMEWDTAAGQAVLEAAGGKVCKPDGSVFDYGKAHLGFANGAFIARGR